jgi:2-methylisocitrate lyase-like PEP mutase family enzyme
MMRRTSFRQLFRGKGPLVTPVAHDALSARLITAAGFPAVSIGGLSMLAAQYGLPDMGIATLGEMVEGARCVLRGTHLPCGVDGDDGYGDLKSVARTVEAYAEIGVGSIIFEDQARASKRPGDANSHHIIPIEDMCAKIRAAIRARPDPEIVILARVDAYPAEGLDGALRRADRYLEAGADGIFVASLATPDELARVGSRLRGAIQVAVVTERLMKTWPSPTELHAMGFSQIVYPHLVLKHTTVGIQSALGEIGAIARDVLPDVPRMPDEFDLGSLQDILGQKRWAAFDDLGAAAQGRPGRPVALGADGVESAA